VRWLQRWEEKSIQGVVTDPPFGLVEYSPAELVRRNGNKGLWRLPPAYDGQRRSALPRFTTLSAEQLDEVGTFFEEWARALSRVLVPGAHVFVASTPHVSFIVSRAMRDAGLERRGEIVRLSQTLRGGDRPKNAHEEFEHVSVQPRSMYEPWLLFRAPLEGRVQDNLRTWRTGGLRRLADGRPFGDVVRSSPARGAERQIAPHPSLKPQAFLRYLVRGVLPLGEGVVLDPFAGSGSTLAAAEALGLASIGVERSIEYLRMAKVAIPALAALPIAPLAPVSGLDAVSASVARRMRVVST
jgi:site-specific DNA-methyltransferase (adenine-specific)